MDTTYQFELNADVQLVPSGERGVVVGRAEYADDTPSYYVRYMNAMSCQTKRWFNAADLLHLSEKGK